LVLKSRKGKREKSAKSEQRESSRGHWSGEELTAKRERGKEAGNNKLRKPKKEKKNACRAKKRRRWPVGEEREGGEKEECLHYRTKGGGGGGRGSSKKTPQRCTKGKEWRDEKNGLKNPVGLKGQFRRGTGPCPPAFCIVTAFGRKKNREQEGGGDLAGSGAW